MNSNFFPAQDKLLQVLNELESENYNQDAMERAHQALNEAIEENKQLQESISDKKNTRSSEDQ